MQFVAALDRIGGMRCVLGLFEGVCTGAADGYARMTDRPAATLLHLAPGLANGLANLHNARRAQVPIVNIVGEHRQGQCDELWDECAQGDASRDPFARCVVFRHVHDHALRGFGCRVHAPENVTEHSFAETADRPGERRRRGVG